ncbi:MAG: metallophosphoesterase [Proteobacteria bacterium]|nr:metallophosphoesterase [Pseudomonadota bacterium]
MSAASPAIPPHLRLYVIGDIHGSLDLLEQLMDKIDEDRGNKNLMVRKIFLGDYVDRGLYSREIIDYLIEMGEDETPSPVFLMGNHEQVMRELLRHRDPDLLQDWLRFGGRETLSSYGVRLPTLPNPNDLPVILEEFAKKIPQPHARFLEDLQTQAEFGDYFFCHAGVRPGVPLEAQNERDLVWIRDDFLGHKGSHGKVVVHGHTIAPEVEHLPNRINIDTGAYATGRLTALVLEGNRQWFLQTG